LDETAPDWGLLPDRAVEFFGLDASFERADLKRAYNRWIRQFKPERHPEEFKRIRAAYELLDERLRYGASSVEAEPSSPASPPPASVAEPAALDVITLVRSAGPKAARDRVRSAVAEDPSLWRPLALLEDAVEARPDAALRVLIEGLRETRGRPELLALAHAFLREALDPKVAAELLVELARACAGPRRSAGFDPPLYWFLTEYVWCDLVVRVRFDSFKALLAQCAKAVGERGRPGELVLLLRLRRLAALRADDEWLREVDQTLAESLRSLPPWGPQELDLAQWLGRYRAAREAFVAAHPFRAGFDAALVAAIEGDEIESERALLAAQVACVERRDELFEAFPVQLDPKGEEPESVAASLLGWCAEESMVRRGVRERADSRALMLVTEFRYRLGRRSLRTLWGWPLAWIGQLVFAGVVILSVLVSGIIAGLFRGQAWTGVLSLVLIFGTILAYTFVPRLFAPLIRWVGRPLATRAYRQSWRALTADFLSESRVSYSSMMESLEEQPEGLPLFALELLARDYGLLFYSLAIRSLA